MKNLKDLLKIPLLTIFVLPLLAACVKDIDLDQMEEIKLQPKAVVDIVNFEVEADLIPNEDPGIPIPVEETIAFEVITDDLEKNVVGVDLEFDYYNSLPRTFNTTLLFLDDRNRAKQKVKFDIPPGTKANPQSYQFVHNFQGKNLELLNESTQVKITVVMQPGPGAKEGELQLLSTAAYQFEF